MQGSEFGMKLQRVRAGRPRRRTPCSNRMVGLVPLLEVARIHAAAYERDDRERVSTLVDDDLVMCVGCDSSSRTPKGT